MYVDTGARTPIGASGSIGFICLDGSYWVYSALSLLLVCSHSALILLLFYSHSAHTLAHHS